LFDDLHLSGRRPAHESVLSFHTTDHIPAGVRKRCHTREDGVLAKSDPRGPVNPDVRFGKVARGGAARRRQAMSRRQTNIVRLNVACTGSREDHGEQRTGKHPGGPAPPGAWRAAAGTTMGYFMVGSPFCEFDVWDATERQGLRGRKPAKARGAWSARPIGRRGRRCLSKLAADTDPTLGGFIKDHLRHGHAPLGYERIGGRQKRGCLEWLGQPLELMDMKALVEQANARPHNAVASESAGVRPERP